MLPFSKNWKEDFKNKWKAFWILTKGLGKMRILLWPFKPFFRQELMHFFEPQRHKVEAASMILRSFFRKPFRLFLSNADRIFMYVNIIWIFCRLKINKNVCRLHLFLMYCLTPIHNSLSLVSFLWKTASSNIHITSCRH